MENYLILDINGVVVNAVACDPSMYPPDPAWIPCSAAPGVWIDWSTPDGGITWVPPVDE